MTTLQNYFNDGANRQAKAVLAYLQPHTIESSWNAERHCYDGEITVSRWENCREQGYVTMLRVNRSQLNIAFFEHRNSDSICAVKWEQYTINAPTIDTAKFGDVYKTKWDTSHSVSYGEVANMANWIAEQFDAFYDAKKANP